MFYASALREDVWLFQDGSAHLVQSRLDYGAVHGFGGTLTGGTGIRSIALSAGVGQPGTVAERLLEALPRRLSWPFGVEAVRLRHQCRSTLVAGREVEELRSEETVEILAEGAGIQHLLIALPRELLLAGGRLTKLFASATADLVRDRSLPLLWRHGSAGILVHEAIGHRATTRHPPVTWPQWLRVMDEPGREIDDDGTLVGPADLTSGAGLPARRRESFRDPSLPRMTHLTTGSSMILDRLPRRRIEIFEVTGGGYDALADLVTITIAAAAEVDDASIRPLRPFVLTLSPAAIAEALCGTHGDDVSRQVMCAEEGQRLMVSSSAPDLLLLPGGELP